MHSEPFFAPHGPGMVATLARALATNETMADFLNAAADEVLVSLDHYPPPDELEAGHLLVAAGRLRDAAGAARAGRLAELPDAAERIRAPLAEMRYDPDGRFVGVVVLLDLAARVLARVTEDARTVKQEGNDGLPLPF